MSDDCRQFCAGSSTTSIFVHLHDCSVIPSKTISRRIVVVRIVRTDRRIDDAEWDTTDSSHNGDLRMNWFELQRES